MLALRLAGLFALSLAACSDPPLPTPAPTDSLPAAPGPAHTNPTPTADPTPDTNPTPTANPAPADPTPDTSLEPTPPSVAGLAPGEPPSTPTPLTPVPAPGLQALAGGRWHLTLPDGPGRRPDHLTLLLDQGPYASLPLPRQRPHCAHPRLLGGHISGQSLTLELRCSTSPPAPVSRRRGLAPRRPAEPPETMTFDLATLSPTRLVAGAPLPDTAPLAALGFPALSPDAVHVALVERLDDGAFRLGVRRVDDGHEVLDAPILTPADVRFRPHESKTDRLSRLTHTASSRIAKVQHTLDRAGFAPMSSARPEAQSTPLALPACTPRRTRAMQKGGGLPTFAGCVPEGCAGLAPVLERWQGGEPQAGLGVEALRVDGAAAGCGPGERWLIRPVP